MQLNFPPQKMTSTLEAGNWEKTSGCISRFQYAADHLPMTASPTEQSGSGWTANIEGEHAVG